MNFFTKNTIGNALTRFAIGNAIINGNANAAIQMLKVLREV